MKFSVQNGVIHVELPFSEILVAASSTVETPKPPPVKRKVAAKPRVALSNSTKKVLKPAKKPVAKKVFKTAKKPVAKKVVSKQAASAVVASTLLERREPSGPGTGGGFYELLSHLGDRRSSEAHREQERGQLALHGDLAVRPILEVIRRSGTDEVVRDAAAVLERVAETEAGLAALEQYINDDDAAVRSAIAYALGSSPSEATLARRLGVLERLLTSDPSTRVRNTAISALRLVGGTSAARLLTSALEHEKIEFLREAITDAIEDLREAITDAIEEIE